MKGLKFISLSLIFSTNINLAQAELVYNEMESLGVLTGDVSSQVVDISSDGSTIVGTSISGSSTLTAFQYKNEEMTSLEIVEGYSQSLSARTSSDGSIIVGASFLNSFVAQAFKYENNVAVNIGEVHGLDSNPGSGSIATGISNDGSVITGALLYGFAASVAFKYEDGVMSSLGTLAGGSNSIAYDLSEDGAIIIGQGSSTDGDRAFKYSNGAMSNLGTISGDSYSSAFAISSDGSVIIGQSGTSNFASVAFQHSNNEMTSLGVLDGGTNSTAVGLSSDGSIIVGYSESSDGVRAFKYDDNTMTSLGVLDGGSTSSAVAISSDGSVIIGDSGSTDGNRAFKYENGVMTSLGVLDGYSGSQAVGLSSDGSVITGISTSDANFRAFIYRNEIIDVSNNISSISQSQQELDSFVNLNVSSLNRILKQNTRNEFNPYNKFNMAINSGIDRNSLLKYQYTNLKLSYDFTPHITIGGLIEQDTDHDSDLNIESTSSTPTIALYADFVQNRNANGFELSLSSAYKKEKVHITRNSSATLSDTEIGEGDSNVYSLGGMAKLAYRLDMDNYILKPYAMVKSTMVKRSGYTENDNIDFPVSFNTIKNNLTSLSLGTTLAYRVSSNLDTSFELGIERNIYQNENTYEASMDYLGSVSTLSLDENDAANNIIYAGTGIAYKLGDASAISANYLYRQSEYGENNEDVSSFYVGYNLSF